VRSLGEEKYQSSLLAEVDDDRAHEKDSSYKRICGRAAPTQIWAPCLSVFLSDLGTIACVSHMKAVLVSQHSIRGTDTLAYEAAHQFKLQPRQWIDLLQLNIGTEDAQGSPKRTSGNHGDNAEHQSQAEHEFIWSHGAASVL
jgi:hypothetical protein